MDTVSRSIDAQIESCGISCFLTGYIVLEALLRQVYHASFGAKMDPTNIQPANTAIPARIENGYTMIRENQQTVGGSLAVVSTGAQSKSSFFSESQVRSQIWNTKPTCFTQ